MIQLLILALYILCIICIGMVTTRKKIKNDKEFYGKSLGLAMCVAVGAGEWLGGTATTGVSEYGYLYGISGAWYTIANGLGVCFLALFFAKLFQSLKTITVPEIIYRFIGTKARLVSGIFLIVVMIVVGVSQMIAIGTIGESLLGLDASVSILILGAVVLLYTCFGGMIAVGNTNMINLVVMYLGVILAVVFCAVNFVGISELHTQLSDSYFSFSAIGLPKISSWIIASVFGACTAQAGLQPILVSKDEKTAVKSSCLIALLVAPFGILTALLGMFAKAKFPLLADAKLALPTLIMAMPSWVSGIFMAAILAAILSTASPIFLAAGTLFTRDVYPAISGAKPQDEEKKRRALMKISRTATLLSGVLCIITAIAIRNATAVLDVVYFAYSLRGSLFIILLLGIYWKGLSQKAAVGAMILTCVVCFLWVAYSIVYGEYPIPNISETYVAIFTTLLSAVAISKLNVKRGHET